MNIMSEIKMKFDVTGQKTTKQVLQGQHSQTDTITECMPLKGF